MDGDRILDGLEGPIEFRIGFSFEDHVVLSVEVYWVIEANLRFLPSLMI